MNTPSTLNIGIVGYGKMGHTIKTCAIQRNHNVVFTVDPHHPDADVTQLQELGDSMLKADIIIEFSLPDAVYKHAQLYANTGISAVVGTTGWDNKRQKIESLVTSSDIVYVYGGNFSIGAHILMRVSQYAARLCDKISDYDISIWESHHTQKKDRPSGTALMTAELILQEMTRKQDIAVDLPHDTAVDSNLLSVVSQRVGHELGFHEVIADSPFDTIKISHHARTRNGFALGAVLAAEWVCIRKSSENPIKGFITVHDFIEHWLIQE